MIFNLYPGLQATKILWSSCSVTSKFGLKSCHRSMLHPVFEVVVADVVVSIVIVVAVIGSTVVVIKGFSMKDLQGYLRFI